MSRRFALAGAVVLALAATGAHASVFGELVSAPPLPLNGRSAGGYVQVSDGTLGALGQLRLCFHPGIDFGFQGGVVRVDAGANDRTAIRVGGDFKAQVVRASETLPLDASLGGALGIETADGYTLLSVGPTGVVSRAMPFGAGHEFAPFAGAGLMFSRLDVGAASSTDLAIPIRLGFEIKFAGDLRLVTEVQLQVSNDFSDDVGFSIGVHSPF